MSNKYLPRLANSIFTAREWVPFLSFFLYIWDLTRRGYINSRRRHYEEHYKHRLNQIDEDILHEEFENPIGPMPAYCRIYHIFSNSLVVINSVEYAVLCKIYYGWLDIDKIYACYLPGRLGLLVDEGVVYEMHLLVLILFIYHLSWSCMWFFSEPFELEGLLFLRHHIDTVLEKQYEVIDLNDSNITSPDIAYRKYLCNRIFYRQNMDHRGRITYAMKQHRTIEHLEQMDYFCAILRLSNYTYLTCSAFLGIIGSYTHLRHDYFDMSYPSCRSFSNRPNNENFEWSFSDRFRLCYLFFDFLDGYIFLLDSTMGLSIPFAVAMLSIHDLCLRFDAMLRRLHHLNAIFKSSLSSNSVLTMEISTLSIAYPIPKYTEALLEESEQIFNETVGTFNLIRHVDDYVRKLSTFTIFAWLILNAFNLLRYWT